MDPSSPSCDQAEYVNLDIRRTDLLDDINKLTHRWFLTLMCLIYVSTHVFLFDQINVDTGELYKKSERRYIIVICPGEEDVHVHLKPEK